MDETRVCRKLMRWPLASKRWTWRDMCTVCVSPACSAERWGHAPVTCLNALSAWGHSARRVSRSRRFSVLTYVRYSPMGRHTPSPLCTHSFVRGQHTTSCHFSCPRYASPTSKCRECCFHLMLGFFFDTLQATQGLNSEIFNLSWFRYNNKLEFSLLSSRPHLQTTQRF